MDLVRLAPRLIVEEVLEAEVRDALGRERYERSAGAPAGYPNSSRTGRRQTAEGEDLSPNPLSLYFKGLRTTQIAVDVD